MSPASSARLFLTRTLISSCSFSTPLDYQDPQTWFQTAELIGSQNQTNSNVAAFNDVVSPTVTSTNVPTSFPSIVTTETIPTKTGTPMTIVPLPITVPTTANPSTMLTSTSTMRQTFDIVAPITTTLRPPSIAVTGEIVAPITDNLRPPTIAPIGEIVAPITNTLRPPTIAPAGEIVAPITTTLRPLTIVPTFEILAPLTATLGPPTIAPTIAITPAANPQDRSPAVSSANSVVVLCSAPNGGASVSAVNRNDGTSAVVETLGISTTSPVQVRLTPLMKLRRATTQIPTIIIRNREANKRRPNSNIRNRQSCDMCASYCSQTRQICAKPEGTRDDLDNLRGFQSVCHMDCFNVCRKFRYEKVADGRCGRLRDGIRPLGSKKKLTRTELNKAQYEVADGDDTIFVVSNTD